MRTQGLALVASLTMLLAACGGGDGQKPPPTPRPSNEQPTALQWQVATLSEVSVALVPGGGYGLDTPNALSADWLGFNPGTSLLDAQQASFIDGAWQVAPSSTLESLPTGLTSTPFHVARAGGWTVIRAIVGQTLYARFDGPNGETSGYVPVSTTADAIGWAAVDASGVARLYWADRVGPNSIVTRTGRFNGATWTDGGTEPGMSLYMDAWAAGPDGKGWLFYQSSPPLSGVVEHYVRQVDAVQGLGPAVRMDDPALGPTLSTRKAAAESATAVTTVASQSSASGTCLAVRRFSAGAWGGAECVNALPVAQPVGETYEVAAQASGRALVVWSDGAGRLYVNVRRATGGWTGARLLATLTAGQSLSELYPRLDAGGAAIVVYRTTSGSGTANLHAVLYDAQAGSWGSPELVDALPGLPHPRVAVTFNAQGKPGVLSFARVGPASFEVHVSTRLNGAWNTVATPADFETSPIFPYDISTIQRLVPVGEGGWSAFWEVKSPVGSGARRLMVATYQ